MDDLLEEGFAVDALDETFFTGGVGELDDTATACAEEDDAVVGAEAAEAASDVELLATTAVAPLEVAEGLTAMVLMLPECEEDTLLAAGAGATATVETTLTFDTATGLLDDGSEAAGLGRAVAGVTTATAGA